jgi:hypothetical protein
MRWLVALLAAVALGPASAQAQLGQSWFDRGNDPSVDWTKTQLKATDSARFIWTTNTDPASDLIALPCASTVFSYYPSLDQTSGDTAARGTIYSCADSSMATSDCLAVIDLRANATINQAWNKPGIWRLDVTAAPGSGTAQVTAQCEGAGQPKQVNAWPEIIHETISAGAAWQRTIGRNPNRVALHVYNQTTSSQPIYVWTTGGGLGAEGFVETNAGYRVAQGEMIELSTSEGWNVITRIGAGANTADTHIRVVELLTVHPPPGVLSATDE